MKLLCVGKGNLGEGMAAVVCSALYWKVLHVVYYPGKYLGL